MGKLLTIASLLLFTASSYASPVKLTASGTIHQSDLFTQSTFQSCCSDSTNIFDWQFESTFDFDEFYMPNYMNGQPSFISKSHKSTTTINGVTAPAEFNKSGDTSGVRHVFETYGFNGYPPVTQFSFTMGVSFDQSSRFMVTDNLYVREMAIEGYLFGFYDTVEQALDSSKITQALIADTSQFYTTYRFWLGDANNPDDNITIGSYWLTSLDHFDIEAVNVPEPSSAILLLLACLGLAFRRGHK